MQEPNAYGERLDFYILRENSAIRWIKQCIILCKILWLIKRFLFKNVFDPINKHKNSLTAAHYFWQSLFLWPLSSLPLHYKLGLVTAMWTCAVMYNHIRVINPDPPWFNAFPSSNLPHLSCRVTVGGEADLKQVRGGGTPRCLGKSTAP